MSAASPENRVEPKKPIKIKDLGGYLADRVSPFYESRLVHICL